MNFLAHLYLSGNQEGMMVGNFIGDFVRGRNLTEQFGAELASGIELHRVIDEFTDNHEVVLQSKKRLRPKYRHYAPVIVDVFYDHFLAANWSSYHALPLEHFVSNTHETLKKHEAMLPLRVQQMLPYLINGNWLVGYAQLKGIHQALSGMSRRTPYDSKMDEATLDLEKYYSEFGSEFSLFFPQLKTVADNFIAMQPRHTN